jgi:hypothetical protein
MTEGLIELLRAILRALLHSASPRVKQTRYRRYVLTYSRLWQQLIVALWLFPVLILVVAAVSPPAPDERWIVWTLVGCFSAVCLLATLEIFRRKIELADYGISQKSPWSPTVTIAWPLVSEVVWQFTEEIVIRSKRGTSIRVSLWLSGIENFADELEARLKSLSSVADVAQRIRALRK